MRLLTTLEITGIIKKHPNCKPTAVENFLITMGGKRDIAMSNLGYDSKIYKWNTATVRAIAYGIKMACK